MKLNSCIKNLLKFILLLQNNSSEVFCCENECTKPFLGPSISCNCYNTRVVTLYNKNGELFESVFLENNAFRRSSYFRIQDIVDDCCTLLILENIDGQFVSTKQTTTINIGCICAVKCIDDINITL